MIDGRTRRNHMGTDCSLAQGIRGPLGTLTNPDNSKTRSRQLGDWGHRQCEPLIVAALRAPPALSPQCCCAPNAGTPKKGNDSQMQKAPCTQKPGCQKHKQAHFLLSNIASTVPWAGPAAFSGVSCSSLGLLFVGVHSMGLILLCSSFHAAEALAKAPRPPPV